MNEPVVIVIFALLFLILIWKSGKTYPIIYLFVFTFFLQYIFSTYFIYNEYKTLKVQMSISQKELFDYTIPALCFLFLGVFTFNKDFQIRQLLRKVNVQRAVRLGYFLLIVSYSFDLTRMIGISSLASIVSFTSYLKYLAVFCFLFSNSRVLYFLCVLVYFNLVLIVLQSGVFIDLITWGAFLFFFICLRFSLSFFVRGAILLTALPILLTIQSVKDEYRKATWPQRAEPGIGLFTDLVKKENERGRDEPFSQSKGVVKTIARLSQGWHLGLTLKRVPKHEPFAYGSEMLSDVGSALLPRFIFQDKKVVHTKEKFFKYTGHKLGKSTSMTIGILGDFYINFGIIGSFIALFLFGSLISISIRAFMVKHVLPDPINIIWVPFILSYLVRADNDFYIFFNGVIKGFIIFLIVRYVRRHYLESSKSNYLALNTVQT